MAEHMLDSIDKALLNIVQGGFPLKAEPYEELGKMAGVTGDEALSRVRRLVKAGVVRKVGPFFDAKKMGSSSTLCAVHVPEERIEQVASIINSRPEVTHNYQRDGVPNLWFTVIAPSREAIGEVVSDICERAGIDRVHNLPAARMFKVKVDLRVE
ncbi:MAG: Lrp/AsnC family transcriptional regulator [Deltaproteobacteria bacterium]|nr:Lrp/AsnC family transcriptional regulator [Deltaproteobacteria bacterium]MBZ0220267.1 AsnC family transcriptional regulator [Deltaproteobacteria bacterium]